MLVGIGTDGGSFEASISENNWLGEGKRLDFNISTDAILLEIELY